MKLELDNSEVTRTLINYASNNLHIPVNRAAVNADGSVTLWWEVPPPSPNNYASLADRLSTWLRIGSTPTGRTR